MRISDWSSDVCSSDLVVGFAVNRILFAMWDEAIRQVEEGACTPDDIDTGGRLGLGHLVGPFELIDNITIDLPLNVSTLLEDASVDRSTPRPTIKTLTPSSPPPPPPAPGTYPSA